MELSNLDLVIFGGYLIAMMGFGVWIANREKIKNSEDYFLASKALPWWAIGGSLIASNISAEQLIAMAGSAFAVGLAIASYEWMSAATLLVVAKYFLPIFIKKNIATIPQFLEQRFDKRVRTGLAIFWVLIFIFVNITSLFYLGGIALQNLLGIPLIVGVIGLAIYSATFSIFGGLRAVVWTDVVQVVVLVLGGTVASVLILQALGDGQGLFAGMKALYEKAPEKFDLIFTKDVTYTEIGVDENGLKTETTKSAYALLPGIGILIGGMWVANLYYWGFNQYIIQRALAGKSIKEAQTGVVFAAFVKLFLPFIVVLPGIAAYVLQADIKVADEAYPWAVANYVGVGFKGIVIAALVAAIGSSISSMVNSTSTIYTLDIHNTLFKSVASETQLVNIGKISATISIIIGVMMAPLLANFGQIFQFIQEYTGFISPGILAIYLFGMFWKKTTTPAALAAVFLAIPVSLGLKTAFPDMPFLDRMGVGFLIISVIIVVISLIGNGNKDDQKALQLEKGLFKTNMVFNLSSVIILGLLAVIYALFW